MPLNVNPNNCSGCGGGGGGGQGLSTVDPRNPDPEQLFGFPDPDRSRPDYRQPGSETLT